MTLLTTCASDPPGVTPAFYHWRTELSVDSLEADYLQQLDISRLYVKFFDVDWDAARRQAVPQATLSRRGELPAAIEIVPTVFITNRTLSELPPAARDPLAARLLTKIEELWPGLYPPEIQIDCDWTDGTRAAYFELLESLDQRIRDHYADAERIPDLSVTLRLHQYRYPERTGVPPVARAMLMYYNMGDLTDWDEPNSILNLDKARPYLATEVPYPLQLDIALPLFRWAVLFRGGRMIKLMPAIDAAELRAAGGVPLDGERATRFRIPESTYLEGYYLYADDHVRLETVTPATLRAAAESLRDVAAGERPYVSFYHLDAALLKDFSPAELEACLSVFNPQNK